MSEITAAMVKSLRERTGAGMMDCKRALEETGGNEEAAVVLLREKGMAAASKRADRETTEGLVSVSLEGGIGAIAGVGCETEPVSKNDDFRAFAAAVLASVAAGGPEAADGLDDDRTQLIGKLGENIVVAGAARVEGGTIAAYVHPPANKIGVLVQLEGGTTDLARQLAMHIAFAAPEWATRDEVPAETVEAERQLYLRSDELQGKPEQARDKIVDGMLGKRFFAAAPGGVLVDQAWIHDSGLSVGKVLADAGATIKTFKRVSVAGS